MYLPGDETYIKSIFDHEWVHIVHFRNGAWAKWKKKYRIASDISEAKAWEHTRDKFETPDSKQKHNEHREAKPKKYEYKFREYYDE